MQVVQYLIVVHRFGRAHVLFCPFLEGPGRHFSDALVYLVPFGQTEVQRVGCERLDGEAEREVRLHRGGVALVSDESHHDARRLLHAVPPLAVGGHVQEPVEADLVVVHLQEGLLNATLQARPEEGEI